MEEKKSLLLETLPTGKPHVSFSEMKMWKECSWRHRLVHIKNLSAFLPSPILEFGTAVHEACENFLKTRVADAKIATDALEEAWKKHAKIPEFTAKALEVAKAEAALILAELPEFMEREFPGWELVDAEHKLYEQVEGHPHAFKGFIDGVIKCAGKRKGEVLYWIIDWKTSASGWRKEQKQDETKKYQLALYKNFWCQKHPEIDPKNVRTTFVILKKSAKLGQHCENFVVSMGPVPISRSLQVVSNMLVTVKRGIAIKNRSACTWCEFKDTEHCK